MRFDIITIFPKIFDSYFDESMIKRAREKKLVDIRVHDLRAFTKDKHRKVDDKAYGGGPGMVIKIEPIVKAIDSILKRKTKNEKRKTKVILFSAVGKQFDAKMAREWSKKYERIVMIAGHYEGIDERIFDVLKAKSYKLEAVSVGPYVLTGGEIPATVVVDTVSRHIPGVLGKSDSLEEKRFGAGLPAYTRPEVFEWPTKGKKKKYVVPKVLLSGDHKKIEEWRKSCIKKSNVSTGKTPS